MRRALTLGVSLAAAAAGLVPIAQAAAPAPAPIVVSPTAEAWYLPQPGCGTVAGCVAAPTGVAPAGGVSPYPAGTLHIGSTAGMETERAFVAFPLAGAGAETPSAATLTVPLDTASQDGGVSPETSHVVACLVYGEIMPVEGSVDTPPTADCSISIPMTYQATPTPQLIGNLAPLLALLPSATGVGLLPDATKGSPTDMWQVVFSAHDRAAGPTGTATGATAAAASVTITPGAPASEDPTPVASSVSVPPVGNVPAAQGFVDTGSTAPAFSEPAGAGGTAAAGPEPAVAPAPATGSAPAVAPPVRRIAATRTVEVGYAYPAIWLLPLLLLFGVPMVSRSLTKEPQLPPR